MVFWSSIGAPFATVTAALKHGRFFECLIIRMYLCDFFRETFILVLLSVSC